MQIPKNVTVLPIYKNKILLTAKESMDYKVKCMGWSFINSALLKMLGFKSIELKMLSADVYYFYLTDKHVNELKRSDGFLFEFYTPEELQAITFTSDSFNFFTVNKQYLSNIIENRELWNK